MLTQLIIASYNVSRADRFLQTSLLKIFVLQKLEDFA